MTRRVAGGPLVGVRAIDFGHGGAGPIALLHLAAMGADVVKVESPRGDYCRFALPFQKGMGATFLSNNLGKRGIVLDLKDRGDLDRAKCLVQSADVVLDNFRGPEVMTRLGLGYEVMRSINPGVVYVQSGAFGPGHGLDGMTSNEWVGQSISGFTGATGEPNGAFEQLRGLTFFDCFTALTNLQAMLVALRHRQRTAAGCMITTSQYSCSLYAGFTRFTEMLGGLEWSGPAGSERSNVVPDLVVAASDGLIAISAPTSDTWERLCGVLGLEELTPLGMSARVTAHDGIVDAIRRRVGTLPTAEWAERLARADVPYAVVNTTDTISRIVGASARRDLITAVPSARGTISAVIAPWRFSRTPIDPPGPPPEHGEHQEEVLADWIHGRRSDAIPAAPSTQSHRVSLPFDDLRVLEVSQGLVGPLCGMHLESMGAHVIKVEPLRGDWLRSIPPLTDGSSALFEAVNRTKHVVRLDLSDGAARTGVSAWIRDADVVIMDPAVARKWPELSYDHSEHGARVVWAEAPAYADGDPRSGTELTIQTAVGVHRHLGRPGGPSVRSGYDIATLSTSMFLFNGIVAALIELAASGLGQRVVVSMYDAMTTMCSMNVAVEGDPDDPHCAMIDAYTDPPWIGLILADGRAAHVFFRGDLAAWDRVLIAADRTDLLLDPRFADAESLQRNAEALKRELAPVMRTWTFDQLRSLIVELGGTIVEMVPTDKALETAQKMGLFDTVDGVGPLDRVASPWAFSSFRPLSGRRDEDGDVSEVTGL